MQLKSQNIRMTGKLTIKKFNANRQLVQELVVPNLVVTAGKQHIASRMVGDENDPMSHMAIGGNSTSAVAGNTVLGGELGRVVLDSSLVNGSIITYSATFGPTVGTGSITEAGIFNAGSGGTMLCRTTFPVVTKASSETIAITWNVAVG